MAETFTDTGDTAAKLHEEYYHRLFQDDPTGIYLSTPEGRILACNLTFLRIFGLSDLQEALNTNATAYYTSPDDREQFIRLLTQRKKLEHHECLRKRKDGRLIHVIEKVIGVFSADGELVEIQGYLFDHTARQEAEEKLRVSEEKYRSIIENAVEGIFQATPEGKYLSVNPAFARMCGFESPEAMTATISSIQEQLYVNANERTRIQALYETEGIVRNFETEFKRQDGQRIWVSINARAVRDNQGKSLFYEGTIEDITERKLAEEALRQSEKRFSIAFHASPAPTIISAVADGRYVDANQSFLNMLEYSRDQLISKTSAELGIWASPEDRAAVVGKLREEEFLRNEPLRLRTRTGEIRDVLASAQIIRLHDEDLILSLFQDITERKRTEEILRESEQRYRDFFRTSRDCVFISSMEGDWIDFNHAAMELFGYEERAELMGVKVAELYQDPAQQEDLTQQIRELGFVKDYPVHLRKKDGSRIFAFLTAVARTDDGGNIVHLQGTIKDLTVQRRLEARLQHRQKMEAIGTLAGGIAHDFNNMLGMIMGFTEMALLGLPQGSPLNNNLREALKAADRAKGLVKQIVSFCRPVAQERRVVQISPLVRESLTLLRAMLPATITIREQITGKGTILGDPSEIEQVVMNLSTNANHAMRGRFGLLTIGLCDVHLETIQALDYKDLSPGQYVKLTVSDTGCGIDPAVKDRIFDPYFTTKPAGEGSGLGLSIVHGIVMNYGGSIAVDSVPGKGTTIEIYLPAVGRKTAEPEPAVPRELPLGKGTILLVDDESALVEVGRQMLELLGYQVVAKTDSREALSTFANQPEKFDLVVTDMTMPNLTGVELAERVKALRADIPVVLCTGYSDLIDNDKAEDLGIGGFIMKPFSIVGLGTLIRKVIKSSCL